MLKVYVSTYKYLRTCSIIPVFGHWEVYAAIKPNSKDHLASVLVIRELLTLS